jgi:carboxymethylenebutenolidase
LTTHSDTKRKTAVVGFCLGGSLVWALSCKTEGIFSAGSGYYGGNIVQMKEETPKNPVILHFGEKDTHIPKEAVQKIKDAHPEIPIYTYDADHGFANTDKKVFSRESSDLAEKRTLEFFARS